MRQNRKESYIAVEMLENIIYAESDSSIIHSTAFIDILANCCLKMADLNDNVPS